MQEHLAWLETTLRGVGIRLNLRNQHPVIGRCGQRRSVLRTGEDRISQRQQARGVLGRAIVRCLLLLFAQPREQGPRVYVAYAQATGYWFNRPCATSPSHEPETTKGVRIRFQTR